MASLAKQGQKYTIRFRHDRRNFRATVEGDRKKANRILATIESTLGDVRLGRLVVPEGCDVPAFFASGGRVKPVEARQGESVTFARAGDEWAASRTVAETTRQGEAKHLRHLKTHFGSKFLKSIATACVQAYIDSRLRSGLSGTTIKQELVSFRGVLKSAERYGYTVPAIRFDHLRIPNDPPRPRFVSVDKADDGRCVLLSSADVSELRAVVRENGSPMIADAVALVSMTGLRRSELVRLRPGDITDGCRVLIVTERKKRHGHITNRAIPVHESLRAMLQARIDATPRDQPLFTASINTLSAGLASAVKGTRFDVAGLGWHVLRHSFISRVVDGGASIVTAALLAGHTNPQTTMRYSHAFDDRVEQAVAAL